MSHASRILLSVLAGLHCLGGSAAYAQDIPSFDETGTKIPMSGEIAVADRSPTGPDSHRRGLGGDLLGLRPRLAASGFDLTGHYVSETAFNVAGGARRTVAESGEFNLGVRIDLQKLAGIDGIFQTTVTYRRGTQLDRKAGLGTLQEVQEIYGRGQTWRLTQFWYEQKVFDGALALKAGRTSPGEDFAVFSCVFQNLSFCGSQPGNIVSDYWFNWPVSQWGGRLRATSGQASFQIAVYAENPHNLDRRFDVGRIRGTTGALVPIEFAVTMGGTGGRPVGSYKFGGWLSTADAPDVFLDGDRRPIVLTGLPALQRSSGYGLWVSLQQQITGRSAQGQSVSGLSVFFNLVQADRRTAIVDSQLVAGLFVKRVIPGVTDDVVGFGLARSHVNDKVARAQNLKGTLAQHSEYAAELFYGFWPASWLELRPNVQWIHHAGGYSIARDIGVAGLKAVLTL